jgi:hypothetical protein
MREARCRLARTPLRSGAALFLLLVLAACGGQTAEKTILTANDLQEACASAYDDATAATTAAGKLCGQKAAAAGSPLAAPTEATWAAQRLKCSSLGVEIPYNPFVLAKLAKPINVAYDAVRAADATRRAVAAGTADQAALSAAVSSAVAHVLDLYGEATRAGLKIDPAKAAALGGTP